MPDVGPTFECMLGWLVWRFDDTDAIQTAKPGG